VNNCICIFGLSGVREFFNFPGQVIQRESRSKIIKPIAARKKVLLIVSLVGWNFYGRRINVGEAFWLFWLFSIEIKQRELPQIANLQQGKVLPWNKDNQGRSSPSH
jgi:hypothetical protein